MNGEEHLNQLLNQENAAGVLVSTIGTKDLEKPYLNALKYDDEAIGSGFEVLKGTNKDEKDELLLTWNEDHLSMNWSIIPSAQRAKFFMLKDPANEFNGPLYREFAYLADPLNMTNRIVSISEQDASSNSNFILTKLESAAGQSDESKQDQLREVYHKLNKHTANQNSEVKSLAFSEEAFLGFLCQTDAFTKVENYAGLLKVSALHGREIPVYRYIYDGTNKASFRYLGDVKIERGTATVQMRTEA